MKPFANGLLLSTTLGIALLLAAPAPVAAMEESAVRCVDQFTSRRFSGEYAQAACRFAEIRAQAREVAGCLQDRGIGPGERIPQSADAVVGDECREVLQTRQRMVTQRRRVPRRTLPRTLPAANAAGTASSSVSAPPSAASGK